MEKIDFSPLKETLGNIAVQLAIWLGASAIAYVLIFIVLRKIGVPIKLSNFLSVIAFLLVMYFMLLNGYIPGITGGQ